MEEEMDKVKAIFCETLGVSESEVNDDTAYNSFEPWDSLKHLRIVANLEEEFGVDIDSLTVIDLNKVPHIRQIHNKKGREIMSDFR